MEEIKKRGRPPKVSVAQIEAPVETVSSDVSVESKPPEVAKRKTKLEYLAEFDNKKVMDVPEEIKKKYPDMHFVWVYNDEKRISPKEGKGYILVHSPELATKKAGIRGYRNTTDDLVKYGDLILMMCPIEYYEAREMKKELDLKSRSRQLKQSSKLHTAVDSSGLNIPVTAEFRQTRG